MRSSVGRLPDGTRYFAPIGRLLSDGDRVCCHLCGRWFLSVASHVPVHGWRKAQYIEAFGLELTNPLTGEATRQRRSAAFMARRTVEAAVQQAEIAAVARARSGALTAAARSAALGRPHSAERRVKTLATLSATSRAARAEGSRALARRRREHLAAEVAHHFGFADFSEYVWHRLRQGLSLAAVSREAGLHKDWVSRQLPAIAPELAGRHRAVRTHPAVVRLRETALQKGFRDVEQYLRRRHLDELRTVAAVAREAGVSWATVHVALGHCGIDPVPHVTKRGQAEHRNESVAKRLGYDSLPSYLRIRRAAGASWRVLAAESGIAETTLRRQSRRARALVGESRSHP